MKISTNSAFFNAVTAGNRQWIIGHLYTFTSASGSVDYFTDLDVDITIAGTVYKSGGLRVNGLKMKIGVGVSVDEQEVVVWASPSDTLFGSAALIGLAQGLMDGGTIARDRAIWPRQTGDVSQDISVAPMAIWRMFFGYMSTIERLGRASVTFKVKSPLVKLNTDMPRNFWQPGCLWSLFDTGCTLDRNAFAFGSVVGTNPTTAVIPIFGGLPTSIGADGLAYYQRGRMVFTSGVNTALTVTIDSNDAAAVSLAYRLNQAPSPGDSVILYPGCSKSFATCNAKFNNTGNFRGFDKVPPVFVSV